MKYKSFIISVKSLFLAKNKSIEHSKVGLDYDKFQEELQLKIQASADAIKQNIFVDYEQAESELDKLNLYVRNAKDIKNKKLDESINGVVIFFIVIFLLGFS